MENVIKNGVDLTIFTKISELADESLNSVIWDMCHYCENFVTDQMFADLNVTYEHIQQEGGGEGGSEYCYGVFKLNDKYYKARYSYYSYCGYEYDYITETLNEVFPKEKTIIVYE
jgi:hypothetical protein